MLDLLRQKVNRGEDVVKDIEVIEKGFSRFTEEEGFSGEEKYKIYFYDECGVILGYIEEEPTIYFDGKFRIRGTGEEVAGVEGQAIEIIKYLTSYANRLAGDGEGLNSQEFGLEIARQRNKINSYLKSGG